MITRVYLEIVRIMPQLVLLFIVYFGATKAMGINLSAEAAAIIVLSSGALQRWQIWSGVL